MFQGFYNLASGMATQNRNLNVISNNMTNVSTPGFKGDTMTSTTFQEEIMYRTGNQDRRSQAAIGPVNMIRVPDQSITNFEDGNYVYTDIPTDFAIEGKGFFKVQATDGSIYYTRNGSFYIDEENCLALAGGGRVQGSSGDIYLDSDKFTADGIGGIYDAEGELIDNMEIVDFADYGTMTKGPNGLFTAGGEEILMEAPMIHPGALEQSNVDPLRQMQDMMATERSVQSASQILKMYDQIMNRASNDIARF